MQIRKTHAISQFRPYNVVDLAYFGYRLQRLDGLVRIEGGRIFPKIPVPTEPSLHD